MLIAINNENPQMRLIRRAVEILRGGGIVIYPTDTVYGMGCDLFNKKCVERIYEIQRRDRRQPLSFICGIFRLRTPSALFAIPRRGKSILPMASARPMLWAMD